MIKITNIQTWGFEGALRGMRMPYESFDKSDSNTCTYCAGDDRQCPYVEDVRRSCYNGFIFGEDDMTLAKKLIKGGPEHRKFLRMIHVQFDIRMARYFATQLDTYKVGTTKNSSSTMHLITKRELTIDDFTADDYVRFDLENTIIPILNKYIRNYNEGIVDESEMFRAIKQLLPESFMQMATYDMTYETLMNIYHQRHNHRLSEWHDFCSWLKGLSYMEEFLEAMK